MLTKRKNKAIRYMNIISKLVLALSYLKKKKSLHYLSVLHSPLHFLLISKCEDKNSVKMFWAGVHLQIIFKS